ncbi:hypothetical protein COCNU_08G000530 [Cocos nucifera]|uniref:Uncharacterized protein n=1 Tax=Cocos nucifera TaxID=13894 RepID=A0A8K0IH52_COCNU|nr:hypothetical protein COCNU_08G000530 [Cocos nucifera]
MPASSTSPPIEDPAPQPPTRREEGKRKKGKRVIMKVHRRACPGGSNSDGDNPREDSFNDPDLIWDLIDKFALPEVADQMADLDYMHLIWDSIVRSPNTHTHQNDELIEVEGAECSKRPSS